MITIYGSPNSSAGRCFWCLEEVGAKYEIKPINFREQEHKSPAYLKINPNGKVPALTDGDFSIWESMAINFYLGETYRPELLGKDAKTRGLIQQWSFWALAELQVPIIEIFIQLVFVPEEKRVATVIEKAQAKLPGLLSILETSLNNKRFLVGDEFSLADLNVASVVLICLAIKYDLSIYGNISNWLANISSRPAFKKYQEMRK